MNQLSKGTETESMELPMTLKAIFRVIAIGKAGIAFAGGMMAILGFLDLFFGTNAQGWYAVNIRENIEPLVIATGAIGMAASLIFNR